ncbi:cyclic nucleotide-binding domain-containing protein 2-like isoform X2 [Ascaphus truei]|uniref:cyclic nucleotide-binding domain-containing protein 2-like isoform X2 n=1 Tax=Ascaphus truei TaxID=8439 RepID=UPI003F5A6B12
MESTLHTNTSLLNGPEPAAHAVEGSTDENDNETEAAVKGEYFLQCNLPEACENMEQTGSKIMFTTQKHLHKFRTAVLIVQVIRNLIKMYRDYAASRAEPISFTEYAGFETETDNLLFDRSYFKAKMEMVVSSEAQFILSSPPDKRTLEGIKLAMLSLRATVDTFAGYPVHIQEKLANVGWYECFGPGRVIIRQGHVPQNFYLILSGTAVVTKVSRSKNTGEHFSKTVAFLKKGKYFGDVAILTMAKRNATVVCHDTVSLLAISRQDFLNIFLNSESQEGPEYIRLLHSIDLLSGWPIHKLPYNNPRICVHTFYRPGTVITKDSKASSKIYVIKTKNEPENEDSSCNFIEEEYLLPVLQMDRKLNEKTGTNAKPKGFVAPTDQSGFSKISGNGKTSQIFIHIQTLRAGDIFGLVYTVFEDTLSMALVSDGAECIVISKEFFKKQMDEEYIFKLSRYIQPYPSKEMLQMKMQDYINWKAYKSHLFKKHH